MKSLLLIIAVAILLPSTAALVLSQGEISEFSKDLMQGVKVERNSYPIGTPVDITYAIKNLTQQPLTYSFSSAKQFDFTVKQGTRIIYTYSRGRMYAQVITSFTLQPGETKMFEAQWQQVDDMGKQVSPGSYTISAQLTPSSIKLPAVSTKVRIGATSIAIVPVTVAQAISRYSQLLNSTVSIEATYRGFQPSATDPNTKDGPPVTRSDWAICDSTGCMYVNGSAAGLNTTHDIGKSVTVTGKLKRTGKGQVYLQVQDITVKKT